MKIGLPGFLRARTPDAEGSSRVRPLAVVGYVLLASGALFAGAWWSIPRDAVAWRIEREANRRNINLRLDEVAYLRPWGTVGLRGVTWVPPSSEKAAGVPVVFKELEISGAPLKYWNHKVVDGRAVGKLADGSLDIALVRDDKKTTSKGSISGVPLNVVPYLRQTIGAAVRGALSVDFDLEIPEDRLVAAQGTISIRCSQCAVGDGKSLLLIPGSKGLLANGVTLPEVMLGDLDAKISLANGVASIENFDWVGTDIALHMIGNLRLGEPMSQSRPDIDIRLKVNEELKNSNDTMSLLVSSAGPSAVLDGEEAGWLGFSWIYDERRKKNIFVGLKRREALTGTAAAPSSGVRGALAGAGPTGIPAGNEADDPTAAIKPPSQVPARGQLADRPSAPTMAPPRMPVAPPQGGAADGGGDQEGDAGDGDERPPPASQALRDMMMRGRPAVVQDGQPVPTKPPPEMAPPVADPAADPVAEPVQLEPEPAPAAGDEPSEPSDASGAAEPAHDDAPAENPSGEAQEQNDPPAPHDGDGSDAHSGDHSGAG